MSTTTNDKIGQRIKNLRCLANLTQKDMAVELKKMGFSTSYVTLSNYETGKTTIPFEILEGICKVLNCTVADVTGYVVAEPRVLVNALRSAADFIEEQQKELSRLREETSC